MYTKRMTIYQESRMTVFYGMIRLSESNRFGNCLIAYHMKMASYPIYKHGFSTVGDLYGTRLSGKHCNYVCQLSYVLDIN